MSVFLIFLLIVSCELIGAKVICGVNFGRTGSDRVIGGSPTESDEFPWMVLMEKFAKNEWEECCGATIISPILVMTASHCIQNFLNHEIRLVAGCRRRGTRRGCQYRPVHIGQTYEPPISGKGTDIALIRLDQPWKFTNFESHAVGPICLPEVGVEYQGMAAVAGWGKTEKWNVSTNLRVADINILPSKFCTYRRTDQKITNSEGQVYHQVAGHINFDPKREICAGYLKGQKGSCIGDSGGPLMIMKGHQIYQIGVVSYGPRPICIVEGTPAVFTKVSVFRDWIDEMGYQL